MRLLYVGLIALALLAGPATRLMDDAHAMGIIKFDHDDERYYFHGPEGHPKRLLNGRYADVTVELDGEGVVSNARCYNNRGLFGGVTTSSLAYDAKVYVKFVFYEKDGRVIREDTWNKKLKDGSNVFKHYDTTWRWGLTLHLDRTNPKAGDTRGYVDVAVRYE